MATINLPMAVRWQGIFYGPGDNIVVPDDLALALGLVDLGNSPVGTSVLINPNQIYSGPISQLSSLGCTIKTLEGLEDDYSDVVIPNGFVLQAGARTITNLELSAGRAIALTNEPGEVGTHPDVVDYKNRIETSGGTITDQQLAIVDQMVKTWESEGILDEVRSGIEFPFMGQDKIAAGVALYIPSTVGLVVNFSTNDYNPAQGITVVQDALLLSNDPLNNSGATKDSFRFVMFNSNSFETGGSSFNDYSISDTNQFGIRMWEGNNQAQFFGSTGVTGPAIPDKRGDMVALSMHRESIALVKAYKNQELSGQSTETVQALSSLNFRFTQGNPARTDIFHGHLGIGVGFEIEAKFLSYIAAIQAKEAARAAIGSDGGGSGDISDPLTYPGLTFFGASDEIVEDASNPGFAGEWTNVLASGQDLVQTTPANQFAIDTTTFPTASLEAVGTTEAMNPNGASKTLDQFIGDGSAYTIYLTLSPKTPDASFANVAFNDGILGTTSRNWMVSGRNSSTNFTKLIEVIYAGSSQRISVGYMPDSKMILCILVKNGVMTVEVNSVPYLREDVNASLAAGILDDPLIFGNYFSNSLNGAYNALVICNQSHDDTQRAQIFADLNARAGGIYPREYSEIAASSGASLLPTGISADRHYVSRGEGSGYTLDSNNLVETYIDQSGNNLNATMLSGSFRDPIVRLNGQGVQDAGGIEFSHWDDGVTGGTSSPGFSFEPVSSDEMLAFLCHASEANFKLANTAGEDIFQFASNRAGFDDGVGGTRNFERLYPSHIGSFGNREITVMAWQIKANGDIAFFLNGIKYAEKTEVPASRTIDRLVPLGGFNSLKGYFGELVIITQSMSDAQISELSLNMLKSGGRINF